MKSQQPSRASQPTVLAFLLAGTATLAALPAAAQTMSGHDMSHMTMAAPATGSKGQLPLTATGATIVAVPPTIKETGAFMTLRNTGKTPVVIVSASASFASQAMLMNTLKTANMAGMVPANRFTVPAGGTFTLKFDGSHVMLMGLKKSLKVGEVLPIVLRDASGRTLTVKATVQKP